MVKLHEIEAVFRAVADPTRREILTLLRSKELSVQDIAEEFPMSRPAISKHLRILKEAELVEERREGRQRIYRLSAAPLAAVRTWLSPFTLDERPARTAPSPRPRPPAGIPTARHDDWRVW